MRGLVLALAIACVAGAAQAQLGGQPGGGGVGTSLTPTVPANARRQAQDAIRQMLSDPAGAKFKGVKAVEVAQASHGAFSEPIPGPISIVCGQYAAKDASGAYGDFGWFFVALKRGKVLWAVDATSGQPDEAHDSCRGAGLAN